MNIKQNINNMNEGYGYRVRLRLLVWDRSELLRVSCNDDHMVKPSHLYHPLCRYEIKDANKKRRRKEKTENKKRSKRKSKKGKMQTKTEESSCLVTVLATLPHNLHIQHSFVDFARPFSLFFSFSSCFRFAATICLWKLVFGERLSQ